MNKLYAIITIFLFSYSIQAQQIGRAKAANEAKPFNKTYYTGLESSVEGLKEKKQTPDILTKLLVGRFTIYNQMDLYAID